MMQEPSGLENFIKVEDATIGSCIGKCKMDDNIKDVNCRKEKKKR